jgi:hypothetical protein
LPGQFAIFCADRKTRRYLWRPANAAGPPGTGHNFGGVSEMLGGANLSPAGEHLAIAKSDYDAFERLLGDIQAGYSTEDLSTLRAKVTPEMLSYFSEQLAANASRGLINRVTDVKLLRGDLAEAWRERNIDYATVAMNFALEDSMVERASGQTVESEGVRLQNRACNVSRPQSAIRPRRGRRRRVANHLASGEPAVARNVGAGVADARTDRACLRNIRLWPVRCSRCRSSGTIVGGLSDASSCRHTRNSRSGLNRAAQPHQSSI